MATRTKTPRLHTQSKRVRFLPFRFASGAISLTATSLRVDGEKVPIDEEQLHRGAMIVDREHWREIRLSGVMLVDPEAFLATLPEPERATPPASFILVLESPETRLRRRVLQQPWQGSECAFDVRVDAHEIAGPVTLTPWLVRRQAANAAPGYGCEAGHRLASGRPLTIHPHAPKLRSGHFLDVRFKAFQADPVLRQMPWRAYFLDTTESPVLFINADHDEVARVLSAGGQTGVDAGLREVFFDLIAVGVWNQLFLKAAEGLSADGESNKAWQAGVLHELLPLMLPSIRAHGERARELVAIRDQSLGLLAEMCDSALQKKLDIVKHMSRLIARASKP